MNAETPDYSYAYDNGDSDNAVWSNLLNGVISAGTQYGLASLQNRNQRNQMAVSPTAAANTSNQTMKWVLVAGGVLFALLAAVLLLKKKGK